MENWCNEYEIDAVDGEHSDTAFWGIRGMTRVSGKHVGRHVRGEVIDDHLKFCKENIRSRLSFDAHKDIEHATGVNDQLRNHTGNQLDLLSTEGLHGFKSKLRHGGCNHLFHNFMERRM